MTSLSKRQNLITWGIVLTGMLFYGYNYLLRTSPSTMMDPLLQHFGISAAAFGSLAACYYYVYAPMQIPVGLIYDYARPKIVLVSACFVALCGLLLFTMANQLWLACVARALIGLGCAFAYIGAIKLTTIWLPANRFATAIGIVNGMAMLAGAGSDLYLTKMVTQVGYQNALISILFLGIALLILLILIVRDKPTSPIHHHVTTPMTVSQILSGFKEMSRSKQMWLIGLISCFAYMPSSVFLDVWGIPYLQHVKMLTAKDASYLITCVFIGWLIASPLIGVFSDKIKRRKLPLQIASFSSTIIITIVLYSSINSLTMLSALLFLFGFFAGAQPLVFSLGKENNVLKFAATATAFVNMLTMLGGMIFQPAVGILIDWHKHSHLTVQYGASDYTFALSVLPLCLLLTFAMTFFLKETHCQQPTADDVMPIENDELEQLAVELN